MRNNAILTIFMRFIVSDKYIPISICFVSKMATHNKTLYLIASKLRLAEDDKVLGKAAEFERLLQTRSVAGSNMTDTSKVVICLDLAAGLFGSDLDLKTAIKYSGLRPSMYTNSKKMIQNLLELDSERLTTSLLCAALQCAGVQSLADKILEEYQRQAKMELDLNLPQYVCMAVYHACRISKVKVSKVKINEKSRLKPSQWNKLDVDWSKFVDEHFAGSKRKRGRPLKNPSGNAEPELMDIDLTQKEESSEPQIEPYEDWKRRHLEAAYKELHELEKLESQKENLRRKENLREKENLKEKENLREKEKLTVIEIEYQKERVEKLKTPRRSPRKTPQKFSPYKSPGKAKGVRLLFPVEL